MGEVFLARQHRAGGFTRLVAVKRVLNDDDDLGRRLLDEARLCAAIAHPNVVGVIDVDVDVDGPLLVLEYVEGGTLAMLMKAARAAKAAAHLLPLDACVRIAHDVAQGLHAAHERAIVHRDVKPANILVGVDGRARIGDFGIALDRSPAGGDARLGFPTRTGGVRGTVPYMSPEQALRGAPDARSDQFSLGVALWEALAGRPLFTADSELATIARVVVCDVPSLRLARDDVSSGLDAVVARMLARDPDERFASCGDAAAALDAALPVAGADVSVAACVDDLLGAVIARRRARFSARELTLLDQQRAQQQQQQQHGTRRSGSALPLSRSTDRTKIERSDDFDAELFEGDAEISTLLDFADRTTRTPASFAPILSFDAGSLVALQRRPSKKRVRPWALAASAAAAAIFLVAGAAVAAVQTRTLSDGDNDRLTTKFLADRADYEPPLMEAIVANEALARGVEPAVFDRIAADVAVQSRRRIEILTAHHALAPSRRALEDDDVEAALDRLDVEVQQTLAPLGSPAAENAFELWNILRYSKIVWMQPPPKALRAAMVDSMLDVYDRYPLSDVPRVFDHFARVRGLPSAKTHDVAVAIQALLERRHTLIAREWHAADVERASIEGELADLDKQAKELATSLDRDDDEPVLADLAWRTFRDRLRIPPLDEPMPMTALHLARSRGGDT